jgi:hypothetical protein
MDGPFTATAAPAIANSALQNPARGGNTSLLIFSGFPEVFS